MAIGLLLLLLAEPARPVELQRLHGHVPPAVATAAPVGRSPGSDRLNLAIGLPLRNQVTLTNLLAQLYDPTSTNYRRYLTPQEFAQRFGPTEADYQAVIEFAQSHGLTVTAKHPNRTVLDVNGSVADIERALHVTLRVYRHPTEARTFYAPDVEPSLELPVPVLGISGLDNFALPRSPLRKFTPQGPQPDLTGSGPFGYFLGKDFRASYAPGVNLTGAGQSVGLVEFDGFFASDITAYETLAGLPNVPVTTVLLDGFSGTPGTANVEVALDIDMALCMAPGLSQVIVYEGTSPIDVLNRMATDNLAQQLSSSWFWPNLANLGLMDQIFQQFAAQGQSYFNASGDSGAYTGPIGAPVDDPNVTIVGGTDLTTTPGGGRWLSEGTYHGSGGGSSTRYPIPEWQLGINMTTNQGSTLQRNIPDVALTATNIWLIAENGLNLVVAGTSAAAPLWAGFTALANQMAQENGEPPVGFLNPAIYALSKGPSYSSLFHDITAGNNENAQSPSKFQSVGGYDLCTGWGSPNGSNLLTALALPEPLRITPGPDIVLISGQAGGPFSPTEASYSLTNNSSSPITWSLVSTSLWLNVSPSGGTLTPGGPATSVTVSLGDAATNLAAGSYTTAVWFTNVSDGFVQRRPFTLAVLAFPAITAPPTNQAVVEGSTATFTVQTASNGLLSYQWQMNGKNLRDGGGISGSTTSELTITNVSFVNVGTYSVIVSNAVGAIPSSGAALTIVPSLPLITLQPTNQTTTPGGPAAFTVAAIGTSPFSYQWQMNGTNLSDGPRLSGTTTPNLTLNQASLLDNGTYTVTVSNTLGSATSTGAVLNVAGVTAPGVTLSTLYSYSGALFGNPLSGLTLGKDGRLYGTGYAGGANGLGTVFRVTSNSRAILYSFDSAHGATPFGGLVLGRDGFFYGTTSAGGLYGFGTLFRLVPTGQTLSAVSLVSFNGDNGNSPLAALVQGSDGNFYGSTAGGGAFGYGNLFRLSPAGQFTPLISFNFADGANPAGVLVQGSDGSYYGTTQGGGTNGGFGTVFKFTAAGEFASLYSFGGGNDGSLPASGLVQVPDGTLYGTTFRGGVYGNGTIFSITPSGTLTSLYSFTGGDDGANPLGGLMLGSDGNLYGTAENGGHYGVGTVFRIAPHGTLATLAQLDGYQGANPTGTLVQGADGNLYGTCPNGGTDGQGAIFWISINAPLQITGEPANQATFIGGEARFSVATFGSEPVSYQWLKGGAAMSDAAGVSGSTNRTLVLSNVTPDDVGIYSVIVSNGSASVSSDGAALEIIYSPPFIQTQPSGQTVVAGMTAILTVDAQGDLPLSYQWRENGTNLTDGGNLVGSTTRTLTLTNVGPVNAGTYSVIVSNEVESVSSDPAELVVVSASSPGAAMTNLYQFRDSADGGFPFGGLMQATSGAIYGTTTGGGGGFQGAIFSFTPNSALGVRHAFTGGADGSHPYGGLIQASNGELYGTALTGGVNGYGTIYALNSSGAFLPSSYSFLGGVDGAFPVAGLTPGGDGYLYGVTFEGGAYFNGAAFRISLAGAVTPLYSFSGGNDGANPYGGLIFGLDGQLYGTTSGGGANGLGTVFKLTTRGQLTTIASFNGTNGASPIAALVRSSDGNFYGTTFSGGANNFGTVFRLTTNGLLTTLVSFTGTNGANPSAPLVQGTDGNLYGTTAAGGPGGQGSVFQMTPTGALATLLWFDGLNGAGPQAPLLQAQDGNFYGTTAYGGVGFNSSSGGGNGVVFQLIVPVFRSNPFVITGAIAAVPFSTSIANQATYPPGDALTFAKVSGPAWLEVAANGVVSGVPSDQDVGTNAFVVSLTDTNGLLASSTMLVVVNSNLPPSFTSNPITGPWANLNEAYAATVAVTATDPDPGDALTFAKVSGPAWLSVASDGSLSGTPGSANAGTNVFLVSATDLDGNTAVATLALYVNSPPSFAPRQFTNATAVAGLPYVGSVATNATDPDLATGDTLAFYKVSGPAWLGVAANGTLLGTPSNADVGASQFLVLVVDSGGLAGIGSLVVNVTVDHPPVFTSNPFSAPAAQAGLTYSASLTSAAIDPDAGDVLRFAKVSGPSWLSVAGSGALSGTPAISDAGTNAFLVSATDLAGLSNSATMYVTVVGQILLGLEQQGGQLTLSWSGGLPPFQVQTTTNLNQLQWLNFGSPLTTNRLLLAPSNAEAWFRVQGQ